MAWRPRSASTLWPCPAANRCSYSIRDLEIAHRIAVGLPGGSLIWTDRQVPSGVRKPVGGRALRHRRNGDSIRNDSKVAGHSAYAVLGDYIGGNCCVIIVLTLL